MRKNVFVFLFVVFFSLASFAEMPSLWGIEYGPTVKSVRVNSLQDTYGLRMIDSVRTNAQVLSSHEITFSIAGISHKAVREYEVFGIAGKSWVGHVDNSPFLSVITTDNEGRVVVNAWTNQGGRAKNFKVIRDTLFESDNAAIAKRLDNDYFPSVNDAENFKIQTNGKRRSVGICGEPYLLETTAYLYEQAAVDSWLFEGDEAALRVYLQNVADSITPALRNSKIYNLHVRLVRLEKVSTVENAPTTGHLGGWLDANPLTKSLLSSGVNTVALWFGVYRGDYTGMAGNRTRVNFIGGGSTTENHEWGHNHYARHQPEDYEGVTFASNPTAFANAVESQFATAVARTNLCRTFCDVIPVFSTPNVSYNGIPTGTEDRNNAGVIRRAAIDLGAVPKCGAGGAGSGSGGNSVFETTPEE